MSVYKVGFRGGLNLGEEENALSASESRNAQNVDISNGDLRTIAGYAKYVSEAVPAAITRLMKFYQNNTETGTVTSYLLAATATAIYYWTGSAWTAIATGITSGDWDYINYQIDETDIVIMGNGVDNVKKWDGTTFADLGGSPPKLKSLTLHSERVWGTGVKAYPNSAFYSDDTYAAEGEISGPENWSGGESNSGEIFVPTWDGGVCIGISNIFSDVVIFKTNNIFRVLGTYPGVYEVKQVYSTVGAIAEKTIVYDSTRAYFLTKEGLYYYNGEGAYPLTSRKLEGLVINASYRQNAVSIIYKNKLYCAIPEGTSTVNNAVIVYDLLQDSVMIRRGLTVSDFIEYDDKLLFTDATGYVYQMGSGTDFGGDEIEAFWETPFTDLGKKNTVKSADTLYFYASGTGSVQVDATFDGKTKAKTQTLVPAGKMHIVSLPMEGRKFKLKFSNVSGSDFVISSPELVFDYDED